MNRREELQCLLEHFTDNVYFQPPTNLNIKYPAIIYSRRDVEKDRANNKTYRLKTSYNITVIDRNPDSCIAQHLLELDYCEFDRQFVSDGLNHIILTLYY